MKKVFGISYVRVENGSWNNGFDGVPREDFDGNLFATDKARKYSLRQDFLNSGHKVLIRKHKAENGNFKSLENILLSYNIDKKDLISKKKIIKDFIDVRLFGAIVNPKDSNVLTTTGPLQILFAKNQFVKDGFRVNDKHETITITSYKYSKENKNNDENKDTEKNKVDKDGNGAMTTVGTQTRVEKAYYMYPFILNPNVYKNNLEEILGNEISENEIKDLYEKDIKVFKESLKYDVSELNSCTKMGCTNFVNIIITMKDNLSNINLSAIQDQIFVSEEENDNKIDITINIENLYTMLQDKKDMVEKIELHVPATTRFNVIGLDKLKDLGIEIIEERI